MDFKGYLKAISSKLATGDATEHSHRPALQALLESASKEINAVNEPRRIKCGAPDFIVNRKDVPVGYVECKDIGIQLDDIEKTDQLKRYRESLDNLILTDYLEFRYYTNGELHMQVRLAAVDAKGKIKSLAGAQEHLESLFNAFFSASSKTIGTPRELAARMANVAQIIRDAITKAFALEDEAGTLHGEYESFRQTILANIKPEEFADMYAQTVCYGMFSARVNVPDQDAHKFTREHAAYDLPATNPFLRAVFEYIAGTQLDQSIVWAVEMLVNMLRRCAMSEILKDFGKATRQDDPIVHFYETFLAAYDPELRESRGVYYTPEPVVGYIVRSINEILKRDFACPAGLADSSKVTIEIADDTKKNGKRKQEVHRVQILDPAVGTGTFLFETVRTIYDTLSANRGAWAGYVSQHLLPRLNGFELMMAPYTVAHLKLGWLLGETGYDFHGTERLHVYLTNTLEKSDLEAIPRFPFANQIVLEANAASRVKTQSPIMVIMGNPPYSGHSANNNQWSKDLIHEKLPTGAPSYFECDGAGLGERNPKWLNDDYVKFIRFSQYRIERTGYGVLGFITNHGYIDNPTFRGMRQSLMQTFDEIYILDLHGNAKKRETAPDGGKDENVFDIQQGVAICLMVKHPPKDKTGKKQAANVFHADLWGARPDKYEYLNIHDVTDTQWVQARPQKPFYLFAPQDITLLKEYDEGWRITDVIKVNSVGIVTARDALTIQDSPEKVWEVVKNFVKLPPETARAEYNLGKDVRDWKVELAQKDIRNSGPNQSKVVPVLYRPFDIKYTYYTGVTRGFICMPRPEGMRHMLAGENLGLIATRQTRDKWDVYVTKNICGHKSCSAYDINSLFPLYLYPDPEKMLESSPWPEGKGGRRPNLEPKFVEEFAAKLGLKFVSDGRGDLKKTFGPEDIFHYAYAVFHSPTYRSRYAEFLKIDFPRLPLTGDKKLFARLCELGGELVGLHLLEQVPRPQAVYPQKGDNKVTRTGSGAYKPPTKETPGRVYINDAQYFDNVPPEVWEFHVGGYQVCEKWLKDRKGRTLSYDDIETYLKITESIRQTIRIMDEIDAAIPSWPC